MKIPTKEIEFWKLENDLDRFPVPIEFDPQMEQRKLYRRKKKIEEIYDRYMQMLIFYSSKPKAVNDNNGCTEAEL